MPSWPKKITRRQSKFGKQPCQTEVLPRHTISRCLMDSSKNLSHETPFRLAKRCYSPGEQASSPIPTKNPIQGKPHRRTAPEPFTRKAANREKATLTKQDGRKISRTKASPWQRSWAVCWGTAQHYVTTYHIMPHHMSSQNIPYHMTLNHMTCYFTPHHITSCSITSHTCNILQLITSHHKPISTLL